MPKVAIDELQEGMELAEDVLDGNGQPMLRSGTQLSDRDLRRFRMWGVMEILIKGDDSEEEGAAAGATLTPEQLAAVEPAVRELFRHTNLEHPLTKLLFEERLRREAREQESADAGS